MVNIGGIKWQENGNRIVSQKPGSAWQTKFHTVQAISKTEVPL